MRRGIRYMQRRRRGLRAKTAAMPLIMTSALSRSSRANLLSETIVTYPRDVNTISHDFVTQKRRVVGKD